jgi:hypothetical protein
VIRGRTAHIAGYALPDWRLGITQRILDVEGLQVEMTHFQTLSPSGFETQPKGQGATFN